MSQNGKHHGGAWKVAYADFVTAMMALFMVLWLTGQSQETRDQMAQYFQDPYNTSAESSMGIMEHKGSSGGEIDGNSKGKTDISDIKTLYDMAQEFMRLLNIDSISNEDAPVSIETTSDGLRVTLYDRDAHPFFVENTPEYTDWGKFVIETLAWLIERHHFSIRIDGYVSLGFEGNGDDYTAWELSTDRANATRRFLEYYRVDARKFTNVTGYGNTKPLPFVHETSESNDRVAISLVLSEPFNKYDLDNKKETHSAN